MFPINLPNLWYSNDQKEHNINDANIENWIYSDSSLTVKINALGNNFSVQVLNEVKQTITANTKLQLNVSDDTALFREVLLKQGNIPLVYAQTIMPDSTVTDSETLLSELGNTSLGQVLFQSPQAIRSDIEFAVVETNSQLGQYIEQQLEQPINNPCYIRRSVFHLNNKPLLVCECFLPALFS